MMSINRADQPRRATPEMIQQRLNVLPVQVINWATCPNCRQSATGIYLGRFGCQRCGYTEGGVQNRKSFL